MLKLFTIENAKPRDKPYKLADGEGLHLLVTPKGKKQWRFRYRFNGKENMLSFGAFPAVSISDARRKRDDARKLIAKGLDPSAQKRADKIAAEHMARNTFGEIVQEYLETLRHHQRTEETIRKNAWLLNDLAKPLHRYPIKDITPADILALLKRIEKSGRRETATRLRSRIGSVFRYAVATLRADNDPTYALQGALLSPIVRHYPAITDEKKFGALVRCIEDYDGLPVVKAAMLFTILTMARPGEVRYMQRGEVDFDKAIWTVPEGRMKMRRPHEVPLSKQAVEVLKGIWDLSYGDGYVFPSPRPGRPLSENAFNAALRRMGYTKDEVVSHGFRSSASTILNGRGYNPDVIEAALAHQDVNVIRRTYNRSRYWDDRVKLLQDWADIIDELKRAP